MRTSDKSYPETVEELVAECDALSNRYDLYSLGRTEPATFAERLDFDDNCPPAGEFLYGCAMIPAQWVLHVLGEQREDEQPW